MKLFKLLRFNPLKPLNLYTLKPLPRRIKYNFRKNLISILRSLSRLNPLIPLKLLSLYTLKPLNSYTLKPLHP